MNKQYLKYVIIIKNLNGVTDFFLKLLIVRFTYPEL